MATNENSSKIPPDTASSRAANGVRSTAESLDPAALSVEQLARMLGVPRETVQTHVSAGAPTGPDGRINLVHYAAWLNRRIGRTDGD